MASNPIELRADCLIPIQMGNAKRIRRLKGVDRGADPMLITRSHISILLVTMLINVKTPLQPVINGVRARESTESRSRS